MHRFLSAVFGSVLFSLSFLPVASYAGDCSHTVMGGGCTGQVDAGVAPHMRSQSQLNTETKTKVKAKNAAPDVKAVTAAKNVKVSNAPNQKPQI